MRTTLVGSVAHDWLSFRVCCLPGQAPSSSFAALSSRSQFSCSNRPFVGWDSVVIASFVVFSFSNLCGRASSSVLVRILIAGGGGGGGGKHDISITSVDLLFIYYSQK